MNIYTYECVLPSEVIYIFIFITSLGRTHPSRVSKKMFHGELTNGNIQQFNLFLLIMLD